MQTNGADEVVVAANVIVCPGEQVKYSHVNVVNNVPIPPAVVGAVPSSAVPLSIDNQPDSCAYTRT
jgi:hypothetical protein